MARKIEIKSTGKPNTFKAVLPKKAVTKAAAKPVARAKRKATVEYSFNGSGVYAALKYLAENGMVRERDAEFATGLAASISDGQTSQRRFFYAKKIVLKADHRDALVDAGFDLGAMFVEQFVAPKPKADDFITVNATFDRMSDSQLAMKVRCNGRNMWVPISQCQFSKAGVPTDAGERVTFKVAKWFATKNNIQAAG